MPSKQAKAPISAHPLFPAVVAVWFAALFGFGSGVLPTVLFEHLITATGISSLLPSAVPPLGATFRIILSLTFAIAGALLGFVLARRLAAAHYVERPAPVMSQLTPRPDAPPSIDTRRRPISVKEELGNTRLDPIVDEQDARSLPVRRRSLALAEDERNSDFFTHAPLPRAEAPVTEPAIVPEEPMEHPLELTSVVTPEPVEDPVYVPQVEPWIAPDSVVERGLDGLRNAAPFAKPFGDEDEPPVSAEPPSAAQEPAPDSPPKFEPRAEQVPEPPAEPKQVFAAAAEVTAPLLLTDPAADLSDLGMVQLAERLAASLRGRLRPAGTPAFVAGLKADFGIETAADDRPQDVAPGSAIFGQSAFEPVAPATPDAEEEEEFEDIGAAEENYSSLLAMKNPFHAPAEFARIGEPEHDDPGAPGEAPPLRTPASAAGQGSKPDPDETERALRSALAALQRMSGAA